MPIAANRPMLFDDGNEARSLYQRVRRKILDEDFDDVMEEWITENGGDDTSHRFGIPDTAMNPLVNNTRQLCTPGLYGRPVQLSYPEATAGLLGPGGHFEKAGFWPRAQTVQFLTVGMGVFFRKLNVVDIDGEPRLVDRLVDPSNVVVFCRDSNPMDPVQLWELRYRTARSIKGKPVSWYVWDQYDISDPANPTFRVIKVDSKGQPQDDVTKSFVGEGGDSGYDWTTPAGKPFIPYVTYRSVDTGQFWPHYRRGMHRGTLRSCEHWTYTSRSALFATGEHVLVTGVDTDSMPGVSTKRGDDNTQQSANPQLTMAVTPGMLTFLPAQEGRTVGAIHIGPGVNLPNLAEFSNLYQMVLGIGEGVQFSDATRQSANPTSGSALQISNTSLRGHAEQVKPLFWASDMDAITKASWMFAAVGENYPVEEVTLGYDTLPLSPDEKEEIRTDLTWQKEEGLISSIDVYVRINPGASREQAKKAILQARIEEAELDAAVTEATGIDPNAVDSSLDPSTGQPKPGQPTNEPQK